MFLIYTLVDKLFSLICMLFINWWAPLLAVQREVSDRGISHVGPRLPEWLAWADTFDADLDAGLPAGQTGTWWTRVCWLYRNHGYGFSYWVLGLPFDPYQWKVVKYYDRGADFMFYARGPAAFNLHVVKWGIRFKLGWKAWNYFNTEDQTWDTRPWGPEMRVPFTFSISLYK